VEPRIQQASGTIRTILVLIGFTAVISQIVLMRELIVVFSGNEISLGLMLASWLLWTALGSSVFGGLTARARNPRRLMASLEALLAVALPSTVMAARASRGMSQSLPGELLGPGAMLLISLTVLSCFCVLSGWLFAAGSRLFAGEMGTSTAEATGAVYLMEAIGSGAGGVVASLVLIRYFTGVEIALFMALLNLLAATAILPQPTAVHRQAMMAGLVGLFVFFVFPNVGWRLEAISLEKLWQGFRLVGVRNSIYGNLAVVETEGSRTVFENGLVLFNVPDPAAAEEGVHYALLEHPLPKSVLLIGGGVNGSLAQALEHPSLERLDYVELDPTIINLARDYFPGEWAPVGADPRVHVYNIDGRLFLKSTSARYDVIILNLPDPQTAQLNRFYTFEFFREAAQRLAPGGLLAFRLTAAENYISPELAEFLRCVNQTLRRVFPAVVTMPGDTVHFFAASQPGILVADAQGLLERLRSRHIQTNYVREYYIPFRMMPDRMADLESQIRPQPSTAINHDFAPIAYYYDVALWSARFGGAYRRFFRVIAQVHFGSLAAGAILVLTALAVMVRRFSSNRPRTSASLCVAAMGATLIGLEILLLLAFQAIYGYVYHQLAILIAAFMAGMAWGSWRGMLRPMEHGDIRTLARLQALAALSPLVLYLAFQALAVVQNRLGLILASQIVFPVLALCGGFLGGYQFPLASRIFFAGTEPAARSPGALYALDLMGACAGALLFSVYLVPVFGFFKTTLLMAIVNLAPAALASLAGSYGCAVGVDR